jgi:hypothetical protein
MNTALTKPTCDIQGKISYMVPTTFLSLSLFSLEKTVRKNGIIISIYSKGSKNGWLPILISGTKKMVLSLMLFTQLGDSGILISLCWLH